MGGAKSPAEVGNRTTSKIFSLKKLKVRAVLGQTQPLSRAPVHVDDRGAAKDVIV